MIAACPCCEFKEISSWHFPRCEIALHHKRKRYLFFFSQMDELGKKFSPLWISRSVVIREEGVRNACLMITLPHKIDNLFWIPIPHYPTLNINNGAKVTVKNTSSPCINRGKSRGEIIKFILRNIWYRNIHEIRCRF